MELTQKAQDIQKEIDVTFKTAYAALQKANIEMGIMNVENISYTVPEETGIRIKYRSIMGTEIPLVEAPPPQGRPTYDFFHSTMALDEAVYNFSRVKELTIKLANSGNKRLPSGRQYHQNPETGQCIAEYYDSPLFRPGEDHTNCAGGERSGRISLGLRLLNAGKCRGSRPRRVVTATSVRGMLRNDFGSGSDRACACERAVPVVPTLRFGRLARTKGSGFC